MRLLFVIIFMLLMLSGCSNPPPKHPNNLCAIFREYPHWYWSALQARKRWQIPISVQMAIIHEESHYQADIRPPREKLLGFIPWFRRTSALGYTQALNNTWRLYLNETKQRSASRSNFANAVDFIGWYGHRVAHALGISSSNAYAIYLAYHEGIQGYLQRDYLKQPWLIHVANKVQRQANHYRHQLLVCEATLPQKPWWYF